MTDGMDVDNLTGDAHMTGLGDKTGRKDLSKTIYAIFLILGTGALLPFNCYICPVDFWVTFYGEFFVSAASLSYNGGNWLCMLFMMWKGYKLNQNKLVLTALTVWLVSLIIIPCFHPMTDDATLKSVLTIIPIFLSGVANGFYFSTIVSIGSKIDPINAQAVMAGNGIAGLIPQFILIVIKLIFDLSNIPEEE